MDKDSLKLLTLYLWDIVCAILMMVIVTLLIVGVGVILLRPVYPQPISSEKAVRAIIGEASNQGYPSNKERLANGKGGRDENNKGYRQTSLPMVSPQRNA